MELKGGSMALNPSPRLSLCLACPVQYALQLVLLVVWQLIIPIGQRLFEVALQGVLLVARKLLVPRHQLVSHCSVLANSVHVLVLIRTEQRSEERPDGTTCAARAAGSR